MASLLGLAWNLKAAPKQEIDLARLRVLEKKSRAAREGPSDLGLMTRQELDLRLKAGATLLVIDGFVIDAEPYLYDHPGGAEIINSYAGTDATEAFHGGVNAHSQAAQSRLKALRIARLVETN